MLWIVLFCLKNNTIDQKALSLPVINDISGSRISPARQSVGMCAGMVKDAKRLQQSVP
jgi:hypothetical protein